jgi:hypothetical protein
MGKNTLGYDCLIILGAEKTTANFMTAATRICGRKFVTSAGIAANAMKDSTVCCKFDVL